jgi:hypothetical protein
MEILLSVIFQGYLDDVVWKVLAELIYFYRQFCANNHGRYDGEVGK